MIYDGQTYYTLKFYSYSYGCVIYMNYKNKSYLYDKKEKKEKRHKGKSYHMIKK